MPNSAFLNSSNSIGSPTIAAPDLAEASIAAQEGGAIKGFGLPFEPRRRTMAAARGRATNGKTPDETAGDGEPRRRDEATAASLCGGRNSFRACRNNPRRGAKTGRNPPSLSPRQPGQHVDPR